jgi:hypothetical protein
MKVIKSIGMVTLKVITYISASVFMGFFPFVLLTLLIKLLAKQSFFAMWQDYPVLWISSVTASIFIGAMLNYILEELDN